MMDPERTELLEKIEGIRELISDQTEGVMVSGTCSLKHADDQVEMKPWTMFQAFQLLVIAAEQQLGRLPDLHEIIVDGKVITFKHPSSYEGCDGEHTWSIELIGRVQ